MKKRMNGGISKEIPSFHHQITEAGNFVSHKITLKND